MKILVIRLSSLGDVVLATGILDATGEGKLDFLTREEYAELLRGHPGIGEVIAIQRGKMHQVKRRIEQAGYDAVLDLQDTARSRLLARWSKAGSRARIRKQSLRRRLGIVCHGLLGSVTHRLDSYCLAAAELDWQLCGEPRLFPGAELAAQWRGTLTPDAKTRLIAIAPGAKWRTKRWPVEKYGALINQLAEQGRRRFVVIGGMAERELGRQIESACGDLVVNLCGATLGMQLPGLLAACDLLIANDSGPMHVAGAVGTPLVAIFTSTSPSLGFSPRGSESRIVETGTWCRPCHVHGRSFCPRFDYRCLKDVSVSAVGGAAEQLMQTKQSKG